MSDELTTDTTDNDHASEAPTEDVSPASEKTEATAEVSTEQGFVAPDVSSLIASHAEAQKQERQEREATQREQLRREQEERRQQRVRVIAELREKHQEDIQRVLDLEEQALPILQTKDWDKAPELVAALTAFREKGIKPISDPVDGIGRVLLSDSFDMVHAAQNYDELEAALHRLVLRGNAATGKEKLAELREKDPKLGRFFPINGRGYLVTYEPLAKAVDATRRRIGQQQHAELSKRVSESRLTISDILDRNGAGSCVAEVVKSFPRNGNTISGVVAIRAHRDGVTLEEVHGGDLNRFLIDETTKESLIGKTFRGKLPKRLYNVLWETAKAAKLSTEDPSSDESETSEQKSESSSEPRKGGRKRRANLGSAKNQGKLTDGGSPDERRDDRSGIRSQTIAEAVRECYGSEEAAIDAGATITQNEDGSNTISF